MRNSNCDLCSFGVSSKKRPKTICLLPAEQTQCDVMVVAESPSMPCDAYARVWAGKALSSVKAALTEKGINAYYTYAIKCLKPGKDAKITAKHIKACSEEYLHKEIAAVKPKHIIVLGNEAMKAASGKSGITDKRGTRWHDAKLDAYIYPTLNQNQAFYNIEIQQALNSDLALFARWILEGDEKVMFNPPVYVVASLGGLRKIQKLIRDSGGIVAIDTETTGLNQRAPGFNIRTIQMCWDPEFGGVVIPWVLEDDCFYTSKDRMAAAFWEKESRADAIQIIKEILAESKIIWHNGKYDRICLSVVGERDFGITIEAPNILMDTMHVAHLLDENRRLKLKKLITEELGFPTYDIGNKQTRDLDELFPYGARDTVACFLLYKKYREVLLRPENKRLLALYTKLIRKSDAAYTRLELRGWPVDEMAAECSYNTAKPEQEAAEKTLNKYIDGLGVTRTKTTLGSPSQLGPIIFDLLKLSPASDKKVALTATGGRSTNNDALIHLKGHEFIDMLFAYRKVSKAISTYILPLLNFARNGGVARTSYKLTGTATGRTSSGKETL